MVRVSGNHLYYVGGEEEEERVLMSVFQRREKRGRGVSLSPRPPFSGRFATERPPGAQVGCLD